MWTRIWYKLQTTVFGGAVIVSSAWVVSKVLGLLRQRMIITTYGTTGADSVFAAFAIPDFIYGTLVLGSLLSAFMPVFMSLWKQDQEAAWRVSRGIMRLVATVFFYTGIILLIGADPIVRLLVGRSFGPEAQHTTRVLMQLMSMNMLLFSVSNVFAGVLQSFKQFLAVSIAPIIYNASIIVGIMIFAPGQGAKAVAYGAILGALLHLSIQYIAARRQGWRWGPTASWRDASVRQIGRLLLPRTIGQSVTQIDQFVNVPIATRLGAGQLSILRMASDIQDAPVSIIGVSLATVSFPVFVELLAQNKKEEFVVHFSRIIRQVLFLIIPLTVLIIQLRAQIVRVLFGAANVSWDVTIATAQTLGFFALSFFAQSLIPILARSFYALKDTVTPVRISIVAVVIDIIGSIVLGFKMGVTGIALSYTIANILNVSWLMIALHRRVGQLDELRITIAALKIMGLTILMAVTVQGVKTFLVNSGIVDLQYFIGVLTQGIICGIVGVVSFFIFAALFKLDEAGIIIRGLQRFRNTIMNRT